MSDEGPGELQPLLPAEAQSDELTSESDELPVVARLVIEVRSDGTRTVARGALEERTTGRQVSLEAKGGTPEELSAQLLTGLVATPLWNGLGRLGSGLAFGRGLVDRTRKLAKRVRGLLPGGARPDQPS